MKKPNPKAIDRPRKEVWDFAASGRDQKKTAREVEKNKRAAEMEYNSAIRPIIDELRAAGYEVDSIEILSHSKAYKEALPVLVRWLPKIDDPRIKESIVRTLSVPWSKGIAEQELLSQFRAIPSNENQSLKWAIGNALEVISDDEIFRDVVKLVENKSHGPARQMLVLGLGKIKNAAGIDTLLKLLKDEEVCGHAIMALRKLNATRARPYILPFLKHPKAWIRQEARKALNKFDQIN